MQKKKIVVCVYANEIILSHLASPIAFLKEESPLRLACVSFIVKYKRKKLFEKVSSSCERREPSDATIPLRSLFLRTNM